MVRITEYGENVNKIKYLLWNLDLELIEGENGLKIGLVTLIS